MEQNNYFDQHIPCGPLLTRCPPTKDSMLPANALQGSTPTSKAGYHPGEKNGKWIQIEDHRSEEGYLDGQPHTISDFGPYPDGWTTTPPQPSAEEQAEQRRQEIRSRLSAIDMKSVRPLRAMLQEPYRRKTNSAWNFSIQRRKDCVASCLLCKRAAFLPSNRKLITGILLITHVPMILSRKALKNGGGTHKRRQCRPYMPSVILPMTAMLRFSFSGPN